MKDFYIHATKGGAVIVSPNYEHVSIGVHVFGGYVRIDMTPDQVQQLIEALNKVLTEETTA